MVRAPVGEGGGLVRTGVPWDGVTGLAWSLAARAAGGVGLVAAALVPCAPAAAQGVPSAIAVVDADSVLVGRPFSVRVLVRPAGGRVQLPAELDTTGTVEPLDPPALVQTGDTSVIRWRLVAWEAGEQTMPIGPVTLLRPGRADTTLAVNPLVQVRSVLPADTAQRVPRAARATFDLTEPWWRRALPWIVGALLGALLLWAWWSRRGKHGRRREDVAPGLAARSALDRLVARDLAAVGEPTRHAVLVGDIVREFLARADPGCAPSLVTTELGAAAREAFGEAGTAAFLMLTRVDALRFGGERLDATGAAAIEREARVLITRIEALLVQRRDRGAP